MISCLSVSVLAVNLSVCPSVGKQDICMQGLQCKYLTNG